MALLSASNLSQSFGAEDIFAGISVNIPDGGKIGIVGPNGVGKTTLLLILAGKAQPTRGDVHVAKRTRVGYLDQEAAQSFAGKDHSVYQEAMTVFAGLQEQQEALHQMEAQMEAGNHSEALFEQYGKVMEAFEQAGGYDYEVRIKQTLDGLGFDEESRHMPLTHLSGGQKTRALLARLLLERPDLLILDEPTNHLDIAAVAWLEGTLSKWEGAVLVVSHDRYFLDEVVGYIWEMNHDYMETYRGNYSHYVKQRQERWDRRQE
ncbi:MAG: ABC-F family ATP-binding cassette domain-containing protein, partial [Methylococcales bacterium]|nr:ABC-F family ATP-binding cassette domain-containing protein [Methylococcales bacterium]